MDVEPQLNPIEPTEDDVLASIADRVTPCGYLTGRAGTGKTYSIRERIKEDPRWGVLAATTGIAAVNLDAVTINSLLGFFDTDSLRDIYLQGRLTTALHKLALDHSWLAIDEVSMMDRAQLDILHRAFHEVNTQYRDLDHPFGLMLVGDFAQLPPVKAEWAFLADCWPEFAVNTTRLTHMWRQDELTFLDALQHARCGRGADCASLLSSVGLQWATSLDTDFDGTTIVPRNDQVDRYNGLALARIPSPTISVRSRRWGRLRPEWRLIPFATEFKLGAYVMILANAARDSDSGRMPYANGDCGHIREWDGSGFTIELVRDGSLVHVPMLVRSVALKDKPPGWPDGGIRMDGYTERQHRDSKGRYVVGQVEYYPLRLAYASTVHKSQGLSLDRVQFDFRNSFSAQPAMCYVSLSRCRTLAGLRLVGQPEVFARKCNADARVGAWL